jgi:hypothetical protein
MGDIGKGVANTLCSTQNMYKKSFNKFTVIRLQRVVCLLCLRNLFCRIHPSFLEAMAWKIVFRLFFHERKYKGQFANRIELLDKICVQV